MCRGELSTVITQLLSVCQAGESGTEEFKVLWELNHSPVIREWL